MLLGDIKCLHRLAKIAKDSQSHLALILKLIDKLDSSVVDYRIGVDFNAEFDKININHTVHKEITRITPPKFVQRIGDIKTVFPRNQQWIAVSGRFHVTPYSTNRITNLNLSR